MAALGDLYVNDAFSAAHRAHVSTEGLAHKLPAFAGRAMEAELDALQKALGQPEHPVAAVRSEEHTSELQSLMRISYAVFCLKKKKKKSTHEHNKTQITITN